MTYRVPIAFIVFMDALSIGAAEEIVDRPCPAVVSAKVLVAVIAAVIISITQSCSRGDALPVVAGKAWDLFFPKLQGTLLSTFIGCLVRTIGTVLQLTLQFKQSKHNF